MSIEPSYINQLGTITLYLINEKVCHFTSLKYYTQQILIVHQVSFLGQAGQKLENVLTESLF